MAGFKSAGNLAHDSTGDDSEIDLVRAQAKLTSIKGGGQGDGKPQGNLSSVPNPIGTVTQAPGGGAEAPKNGSRNLQAVPDLPAENQTDSPDEANSQGSGENKAPGSNNNQAAPGKPSAKSKSNNPNQRPGSPQGRINGKPGMGKPSHETTGTMGNRQHTVGRAGGPDSKVAPPKPSGPDAKPATPAAKPKGFSAGIKSKYGAFKSFGKKNQKTLTGASLVGFTLATLVTGFFALLPLKIEAMVKAVSGEQYGRVEHAIERRAERIVIRYGLQGVLNPTGGIVATGANPLIDLFKTWRVQNFEQKLADNGIKFEKGNSRHSIRISVQGSVGEVKATELDILDYLDRDLKGREAQKLMRIIIRDQTKWPKFLIRRPLRSWVSNAYGVKKWSFFKKDERPEDTVNNFDRELGTAQSEGYLKRIGNALNCILGGTNCPSDTPPTEDPGTVRDPAPEGQQASTQTEQAMSDLVTGSTSEEASKTLGKKLTGLLGSKVVPILGWIDLAAHVDDFIWNRRYVTVVNDLRKVQYADTFATWAKITDQIKDGSVTAMQVNMALKKLDDMEKSRMFQELFMGKSAGKDVDSSKDLNLNPTENAFYHAYTTGFVIQHLQLTAYLHSIGWVVEKLSDALGWVIKFIPGVASAEQWLSEKLSELLMWIIGPIITGKDNGLQIGNAVRLGADIIANEFMHNDLGGTPISPKTERETLDVIAQERREAPISLRDRLFSTEDPQSFISRLAVSLPSSPMRAAQNGFNSMLAVISNPLSVFAGGFQMAYESANNVQTEAAGATHDRWGVDQFGYTEAMLGADINEDNLTKAGNKAKEAGRTIDQIRPTDCPDVPAGQPNYCRLDVRTIQTLKPQFTTTDDGGFNSDPLGASGQ